MFRAIAILSIFLSVLMSMTVKATTMASTLQSELNRIGVKAFTASDYRPGNVKHIVLFRYAESVTPAQKQAIISRFLALTDSKRAGKPYIVDITTGTQNSGEGLSGGYTQAFIVTFRSEGDRNFYVGTPFVDSPNDYDLNHDAFKQFVGPYLADKNGVLVFDFTASE